MSVTEPDPAPPPQSSASIASSMAPRIEDGDECDWIVFAGNRRPILMIDNQAGRSGKDSRWWASARGCTVRDPAIPIEAAVLCGGGPLGTANRDLYIESFRACDRGPRYFCGVEIASGWWAWPRR